MQDIAPAAWLEGTQAQRTQIAGPCFIGRSSSGSIVLRDENVSRRHAVIQCQSGCEYWLIDLGSANGTYLNGRRIIQPLRLNDGDQIKIADHVFSFHMLQPSSSSSSPSLIAEQTVQQVKTVNCWLLVADIESSTQLARKLPPEELFQLTGRWLSNCKQLVEDHGGAINKFLGDGFFAYWYEEEKNAERFGAALAQLSKLRDEQLRYRVVAHFGKVFVGGGASLGEESLFGNEVNFVFRMEKLAATLGLARLVSEAAKTKLDLHLPTVGAQGSHALAGFEGEHPFFEF